MNLKQFIAFVVLTGSLALTAQVPFVNEREHINLTDWTFKKGIYYNAQKADFDASNWEKVSVPHTYSMDAIEDVGYYRGQAWYRTKVTIPESMKDERIFIRFEGVGQEAILYVNEKRIGQHIGGYSAFCFEITKQALVGQTNEIVLNVTNEPNYMRIPVNDKLFNHYGGIYRPVQIFSTPQSNITPAYYASSGVFVELKEQSEAKARVEVRTHLSSTVKTAQAVLNMTVLNQQGQKVLEQKETVQIENNTIITNSFEIDNPVYWQGRENPYLYTLKVEVDAYGEKDIVKQTFGLRTFKIDPAAGLTLNGQPYLVRGVCMHQEWKQVGPALTTEQHKKDIALVDEIGATGLRLSHYQHSDITYQQADEIGLMVWAEIPFVHDYSGREFENAKQQLTELILQNYNHTSIFVWGLWNEVRAWKSPDEPCVKLTKELNELAHELDKTRLTTSASDRDMTAPMTNISDLQAYNKYYGWYYGEYADMATWIDNTRKDYPKVPIGISEYGIGGNIYQQDISKLEKPSGNYFPEEEQTRYHELTWKIIRDRPFIWGTFIWNMYDFSVAGWNRGGIPNLNHKGLVTYDREVKKDAFYFYKANWSQNPVVYISELRNNKRTKANTQVKVYCNLDKVTLTVNGKKLETKKVDSDIFVVLFKHVTLQPGTNTLMVSAKKGNEVFTHEAIWELK